jgi:hypothetical protein
MATLATELTRIETGHLVVLQLVDGQPPVVATVTGWRMDAAALVVALADNAGAFHMTLDGLRAAQRAALMRAPAPDFLASQDDPRRC